MAGAELVITRAGLKFNVSRGPHAAGSGEGDAAAESWSREAKIDHELALLRIPGAYCTALWLRSSDGKREALVPRSRAFSAEPQAEHGLQRERAARCTMPKLASSSRAAGGRRLTRRVFACRSGGEKISCPGAGYPVFNVVNDLAK